MHINTKFSPVLPAILTSILDPKEGAVRVETNNYYTGLHDAFAERGFKTVDVSQTPDKPYNTIVATLPFGLRGYPEVEMIERYKESPASKIILVVANNFLFSNHPKLWRAKKGLLESKTVEASILLPQGLMPDSIIPVSLLIIDKTHATETPDWDVKFINASSLSAKHIEELNTKGDVEAIRALVTDKLSYDQPECVSKHPLDLVVQGASLLATAHCISDEQKRAQQFVENSNHVPLSEVANFFRPLLPCKDKKGEKIHILKVQQLSQHGYTSPMVEQDGFFERSGKTDPMLRAGDIVIGIRGVLGKVGIISPDFPDDELWVASQSCIVLRPAKKDYDARLLFMYLRSEIGQCMIHKMTIGATVPMVQINDLKKMPVILPSPEQAVALLASFEKEVEICKGITELEQQRDAMAKRVWPLDA